MKTNLTILITTVLFLIIFGSVSAFAQSGQITGGYGDANVKDAKVVKAAKFAIKEEGKKEHSKITLVSIKKAKVQVVAGLNYELCLELSVKKSGKKAVKQYAKTVVYRNLKNVHSLTSWGILKNLAECEGT